VTDAEIKLYEIAHMFEMWAKESDTVGHALNLQTKANELFLFLKCDGRYRDGCDIIRGLQ